MRDFWARADGLALGSRAEEEAAECELNPGTGDLRLGGAGLVSDATIAGGLLISMEAGSEHAETPRTIAFRARNWGQRGRENQEIREESSRRA